MDTGTFPARRSVDKRPIDSVDRSPMAVQQMPAWRRSITHPAILWLVANIVFTWGQLVLLLALIILRQDPSDEAKHGWTMFIASTIGYALILWLLERRRPVELTRSPLKFLAAGMLIGAGTIAATVGGIHLLGGVEWGTPNDSVDWLWILIWLGIGPAIGEELMFRGVFFRYAEQALGTWFALVLSAALFGAVHMGNDNATWWGAVAIAIEAGVMFGVLYALTRSLWLVIGIHFAWNVVQGMVFGYNVSGLSGYDGWLTPTPVGNPLISGGAFGAEGSVVTIVVSSLISICGIVLLVRSGGVIAPAWARKAAVGQ
ncbi:CPBP family intramembrane metalloprotease [Corynebacterium breve]|uniref:CPBP family intramembrane metalloprotease n=1 Tax=Corynebacterium breve TaxID=3049799 RepID=A0ABY8VD28_9CORY|nr:CPBP family intramembrane glutamic endopeptidase [Corynebacterium breve]WIM66846.1 CPBP family intramembrane metalloprotease [Corynebacterium breve]